MPPPPGPAPLALLPQIEWACARSEGDASITKGRREESAFDDEARHKTAVGRHHEGAEVEAGEDGEDGEGGTRRGRRRGRMEEELEGRRDMC